MSASLFLRLGLATCLLSSPTPSVACSMAAPTQDVWNNYVVFVGFALETKLAPNRQLATRYRVEASNQLKRGEEVTIFVQQDTCAGGTHPVGTRGIVLARDQGPVLTTSSTLRMTREERRAAAFTLGLSPEFGLIPEHHATTRAACIRPRTVDEAFKSSDAIMHTGLHFSCYNESLNKVESVIEGRYSYKGPSIQNWFIMLHAPEYRKRTKDDQEFVDQYQQNWPPAEFLREIPNLTGATTKTYANDGCLIPMHPQGSMLEVTTEMNRYFASPSQVRAKGGPTGPYPALTCSTLDNSMIWKAKAHLAAHKARMRFGAISPLQVPPPEPLEKSQRPRRAKTASHLGGAGGEGSSAPAESIRQNSHLGGTAGRRPEPCTPAQSGCASCSVGKRSEPNWRMIALSFLLAGCAWHRRASGR